MALQIVGAGLGRTGTLSTKLALEMLGFAPCHHMVEVFTHPEQAAFWNRAAEGEAVEWEDVFAQYRACVDWPSCHFYKALSERYPDAKVLLTMRDPKSWFESASSTIFQVIAQMRTDPVRAEAFRFAEILVAQKMFAGRFDEAHAIAAYERHNAAVIASIAPERLLVFDVKEGWAPLCAFLGVPVPCEAFPRVNSREQFLAQEHPVATAG